MRQQCLLQRFRLVQLQYGSCCRSNMDLTNSRSVAAAAAAAKINASLRVTTVSGHKQCALDYKTSAPLTRHQPAAKWRRMKRTGKTVKRERSDEGEARVVSRDVAESNAIKHSMAVHVNVVSSHGTLHNSVKRFRIQVHVSSA